MTTTPKYDYPKPGCYIDESAGSADDCNRRTIELAADYGFEAMVSGCFDGLRGLCLDMTIDQAESASHQGQCDEDVAALTACPEIAAQLDKIGPDAIRLAMKEVGAWDTDELSDDDKNRLRAVWQAACQAKEDLRENSGEQLSEIADDAVTYLNTLETRSFMYWQFEDNSLFLTCDADSAKEDCEFVSGNRDREYPPDGYRGEWLHISDHGNATLYVRGDNGHDTEVWGVV